MEETKSQQEQELCDAHHSSAYQTILKIIESVDGGEYHSKNDYEHDATFAILSWN